MKKSRFTESQIVSVLREGEAGVPIAELTRKHGISRSTYFDWRSRCAGVSVSELKRIKELEVENAKLKRMYASLIRGSERWRGIRMSAFEPRQLEAIREELHSDHDRRTASPIRKNEAQSPSRISSKDRTWPI